MSTITTTEAKQLLGNISHTAFHVLRRRYPGAFVVVKQGTGYDHETHYDREAFVRFLEWRHQRETFVRTSAD